MSLPKIDFPLFNIILPNLKKKITFRPFVTREVKILHQASEGGDHNEIIQAIKQVVNNCIVQPSIDVDKLSVIDLEYFFVKLRAKSVGEVIQARYICQTKVEGGKCGNIVSVPVDLDKLEPTFPTKDLSVVMINPNLGVKLKYPTFEILDKYNEDSDDISVLSECVESVFTNDEVFDSFTLVEIKDFLLNLNSEVFSKLLEFFDNLPEIKVEIPFHCKKCGKKEMLNINGLNELSDFFD